MRDPRRRRIDLRPVDAVRFEEGTRVHATKNKLLGMFTLRL